MKNRRVILLILVLLVATSLACVGGGGGGNGGSGGSASSRFNGASATATHAAQEFHLQLTLIARIDATPTP